MLNLPHQVGKKQLLCGYAKGALCEGGGGVAPGATAQRLCVASGLVLEAVQLFLHGRQIL